MTPLPYYPGSKQGGGQAVAKRLVTLMPAHARYVEGFFGGGALLTAKLPARLSVGIDLDPRVVRAWQPRATPRLTLAAALGKDSDKAGLHVACADAVELLASPPAALHDRTTLLYLDPPYLLSTRSGKRLYRFELPEGRHKRMLRAVRELHCLVMISHYPCELYDEMLEDWTKVVYPVMTRGGPRDEACYCNFPPPAVLHDPRNAGDGFRERERIKRKAARWQTMFARMSPAERGAVAAALADVDPFSLRAAMGARDEF